MKYNSYNFCSNKGLAKKGTYYCQSCAELKKGKGYRISKSLDDCILEVKVCKVCAILAKLNPKVDISQREMYI